MVHDECPLQEQAELLGRRLADEGARLAVAESCTGGLLSKVLTDVPGASGWFERGIVVYSNAAKQDLAGVPKRLIEEHGAVSQPVAEALAAGLLARAPVTYALAITGIAGPDGGTQAKPVGTVWIGWACSEAVQAKRLQFSGGRAAVRKKSVAAAMRVLSG